VIDQFLNPLRSRTWPKEKVHLYGKFSIRKFFSYFLISLSLSLSPTLFIISKLQTFFYKKRTNRGKKALIRLFKLCQAAAVCFSVINDG
jgi:hypothetical protein